jgi:hypothetical protein
MLIKGPSEKEEWPKFLKKRMKTISCNGLPHSKHEQYKFFSLEV